MTPATEASKKVKPSDMDFTAITYRRVIELVNVINSVDGLRTSVKVNATKKLLTLPEDKLVRLYDEFVAQYNAKALTERLARYYN